MNKENIRLNDKNQGIGTTRRLTTIPIKHKGYNFNKGYNQNIISYRI